MVLNGIEKQSSTQLHFKASLEAAVCRCFSKQVFLKISYRSFPVNLAKFFRKLKWLLFQFDKVTVQCWASAHLLFLIKNTMWDCSYNQGLQICSECGYYQQKPFQHKFLHALEKYEKVENVDTQYDYKITSKKMNRYKKPDLLFVFC